MGINAEYMGSEQRMAEDEDKGLAKDTGGEEEARGAPVSAGPCSLLAWPLGNLASLLTGVPHLPDGTHFRPPPAKPFGEPLDHVRTCLGSIRSFLLAYLAVFYIHGGPDGDGYPAFGAATTLSWLDMASPAQEHGCCLGYLWVLGLADVPFSIGTQIQTIQNLPETANLVPSAP